MMKKKGEATDLMSTNNFNDSGKGDNLKTESNELSADKLSNDVYSSYIFASSNRSISKYGERLLMELIFTAHEYIADIALGNNRLRFEEVYNEKFAVIDIPIRRILNEDDTTNYTAAKRAAIDLMKVYHSVESPVLNDDGSVKTYKDGKPQYQFLSYHLLDQVAVNKTPGIVSVKLGAETWSQILDMGKGYTHYDLIVAKRLDNVVAIRLFQLLSNTQNELTFSIERLKEIFGTQNKYNNNTSMFIKRIILPAEEEIKQKCTFTVEHECVYSKTEGGNSYISGLKFRKTAPFKKDIKKVLDSDIIYRLVKNFSFSFAGLQNNVDLFSQCNEQGIDLGAFLDDIEEYAQASTNKPGYIIASLKKKLKGYADRSLEEEKERELKERMLNRLREDMKKKTKKQPVHIISNLDIEDEEAFEQSQLEEL